MLDLSRLLRPASVAVLGGGWAANVVAQLLKGGFDGDIWPVHPSRRDVHGIPCLPSLDALPGAPDACFVGVNREATVDVVRQLSAAGTGGAVCFASGFLESEAESAGGARLQTMLVEAAGTMPFLGPNCYGLINYLDRIALWPDQHGGVATDRGVAIVVQSSNIAINMTMQARGLPIAYVVAAGNQAQTGSADIATALLRDERVSAIGLHIEGFGDIRKLERLAFAARKAGKPVVALKIGRSGKSRIATMSHTASLTGSTVAASALLERLGFVEVGSIAVFLETLNIMHGVGTLAGDTVCSVSCSGGEASLMSDAAEGSAIRLRDFTAETSKTLKGLLGPIVTIGNPLDYHTFIWGDTDRMTQVFSTACRDGFHLVVFILDMPRPDRCDPSGYQCAVDAIIAARRKTQGPVAVLATLGENMNEKLTAQFERSGVLVLHGMDEALAAIDACIRGGRLPHTVDPLLLETGEIGPTTVLEEDEAKQALAAFGLAVPRSCRARSPADVERAASGLSPPLAVKGLGIAHKSEAGAVRLHLQTGDEARAAAEAMTNTDGFLVEEMATQAVAELHVGIVRDATGIFLLTVGSGGVLAELVADTYSQVMPVGRDDIGNMLRQMKVMRLIEGYRGGAAADLEAVIDAIQAICAYGESMAERLVELDVNPLIARERDAIAVDALIRLTEGNTT